MLIIIYRSRDFFTPRSSEANQSWVVVVAAAVFSLHVQLKLYTNWISITTITLFFSTTYFDIDVDPPKHEGSHTLSSHCSSSHATRY